MDIMLGSIMDLIAQNPQILLLRDGWNTENEQPYVLAREYKFY